MSVRRVYVNNLVPFLRDMNLSRSGWWRDQDGVSDEVARKSVPVRSPLRNTKTTTSVDLSDVVDVDSRGVFRLHVQTRRTPR